MPAGNHQRHKRRQQIGMGHRARKQMAFNVVYAHQGQARAESEPFAHGNAHQQTTDQPGALGHCDAAQIAQFHIGF